MQNSQHELVAENSELRLSIRNASHSMRRSLSLHADKSNSLAVENANLRKHLRQIEDTHSKASGSRERSLLEASQENQLLQVKVESLVTHLEARNTDYDVQKLVIGEMTEELQRLRAQVQEYRDNANLVPSSNGDEELQRQINEDIAKDNRNLRSQVEQLAESLSQLQATHAEMVPRGQFAETLRVNRQLNRRLQTFEEQNESLRRQMEELRAENGRLGASGSSSAVVEDVPPPAYAVVG